ncbi:EscU/YscU/HrcU family type III secretion system export apparatus switch protein [Candidatus Liberibacter solanacearum]|uniref:Flagellar biosynthesis protein FlhB n=1 Tax=Candidatus Liberibacter solanacearum TaxID=556287 RepID=A0A1V2N8N1_9HYPH|nr:flagellar type III secretion system protein FlhB [Candidatus Liberibacter solanacearum]ONI59802.1 flagellar biosynthesis protein FlhB [Candidatus Liberibacter solanacearum]ONI60031.1 flagellar biosynthesis protein FlhB [Candidatus Liberibacter solanacearum]
MSENDNPENKTESPSSKKIEDALSKGNAPVSREVYLFSSTLACLIYLLFFVSRGIHDLTYDFHMFLASVTQWKLDSVSHLVFLLVTLGFSTSKLLIPGLLLFMIFGVGSYLIQRIPSFNLNNIRPSLKRISLREGIKRIYSTNNLINFTKSSFKIVIVGTLIAISLKDNHLTMLESITSNPQMILHHIFFTIRKILIIILLFIAILTIIDIGWTYYQWYSKLKMSKQEVKDEIKQSYGNPMIKSRQKSIARSRIRHKMIEATSRATLVITNPTHYALALRYVPTENDVPIMVAKGQNLIASKIRKIASEKNIPIFEDPLLARSLFRQVPINSSIPPVFYKAIAQLIHKIYSKNG